MAYDVSKRPGEWVAARARREFRLAVAGTFAAVALAVLALLVSLSGALITVGLLGAAVLVWRATDRRIGASERWEKGKLGEQAVGEELAKLRHEGFVVMHDVPWNGDGNLDHVVRGPTGVFLIETKFRGYETWQLGRLKRHAAQLHDELGVWVTPVLCKATVDYQPRPHRKVWVMGKRQLLDWIREQRNPPGDFDGLAHWADGL